MLPYIGGISISANREDKLKDTSERPFCEMKECFLPWQSDIVATLKVFPQFASRIAFKCTLYLNMLTRGGQNAYQ